MSVKRIYVEKMADYAVEAKNLLWEIRHILQIKSITGLRLLNRYDVEGVADELYTKCLPGAISKAYEAAKKISFTDMHMRSDIGQRALAELVD